MSCRSSRQAADGREVGTRMSLKAMSAEIFRNGDDHVGGNPKGKVSVVEFFDYNCGYCKRAFPMS